MLRCRDVQGLIHTNICGPFIPFSIGGYMYFITFTDDFSRYGFIELICENSNALNAFKEFKMKMELKMNKKMNVVRSDR